MTDVAVIGAGIGGIAAAARLARRGYRVRVFEKGPRPGGRCGRLLVDGHTFDTGPTLYLMPRVFEETFSDLGQSVPDHIGLLPLDPTYRVSFHDGSWLDLTPNLVHMRDQLESLEPGSFQQYLRFLAAGYECHETSLKDFVGRNFLGLLDYFSPANIPRMLRVKALTSHHDFTARHFRDPRLRAAFSFQNMYLGLSPYDAMATYALLQYTELAEGVWYPKGGLYRVVEALVAIAERLGVEFRYETPVTEIGVDTDRVTSLRLGTGEAFPADLVVANAELPYVYGELLPDGRAAAKLSAKRYTSSALMFYWGLRGPRPTELLHHNVFVAEHRYRESFDRIFEDLDLPDEPSFYICAPSRTEPDSAPAEGDSLTVLVPVGRLNHERPQDWEALRARARDAVLRRLARLGLGDLASRIVFERTFGPPEYEAELNLPYGAAFGLSHNFGQVGYLRPHNRHPRYGNLYFVGASTHPGTGLPLVLLSARLVVERLTSDNGENARGRHS